jgi:diaminopimelate decarboxylase
MLLPFVKHMHDFVKEEYTIWGYGCETDDIVAKYWLELSNTQVEIM